MLPLLTAAEWFSTLVFVCGEHLDSPFAQQNKSSLQPRIHATLCNSAICMPCQGTRAVHVVHLHFLAAKQLSGCLVPPVVLPMSCCSLVNALNLEYA